MEIALTDCTSYLVYLYTIELFKICTSYELCIIYIYIICKKSSDVHISIYMRQSFFIVVVFSEFLN